MRASKIDPSQTPRRLVGLATAGYGLVLLARPSKVTANLGSAPHPDPRIVRVLGVRELAQGIAVAAYPRRFVVRGAVATDLAHGTSMVAAAVLAPRWWRPALISAAIAFASAAALGVRR